MVVTPSNKYRLFLSACYIFTINGILTILFMILNLPFSFIIVPLIICVTGLVIFSAYGAYVIWRSLNSTRGQRLEETTPLLEKRENLELGLSTSSDISTESTETFGRKKSSPIPTPKIKVTHHHPTPMPRESYLTDIFMAQFKVLGDYIRSRHHTVSESDAIDPDNINLKSARVHTISESEMMNQSARISPNNIRRKHSSGENEDLFDIDINNEDQHNKGSKNS